VSVGVAKPYVTENGRHNSVYNTTAHFYTTKITNPQSLAVLLDGQTKQSLTELLNRPSISALFVGKDGNHADFPATSWLPPCR